MQDHLISNRGAYQYTEYRSHAYRSSWVISCFIAFSMMLLSCNKLISVPLDKAVLFLSVLLYFPWIFKSPTPIFTKGELRAIFFLMAVTIVSLMVNSDQYSFQLFLPIVGLIFSALLSQSFLLIRGIYFGSFLHILIANVFGLSSYVLGANPFVSNLAYKGMPMLNSLLGFTPTPQSFGTLCLSWLILYFFFKERGKTNKWDSFFYCLVTLGIFLSVNRTTYIGYLMILFFKQRKLLYTYLAVGLVFVIVFWTVLMDTLFNANTLDAREELLDGFNRSFWGSNSWYVYLFGKGDNKLAEKYIRYATWDNRDDIENGFAMILHMLGFLGLAYYFIAVISFITKIVKKKYFYEGALVFFFCVLSPYITQEYVATTFYIVLGILIYIYKKKQESTYARTTEEVSRLG